MPIVNGSFVSEPLGNPESAQNQVFGDYSRRDMSDYSQAAYNYLMKQQEQAYNLDMWHLVNEYNSPEAQMKRYQDAGLNPNLIYSQQNTSSQPGTPSAARFQSSGNYNKTMQRRAQEWQAGMQAVGQIMDVVKSARETYNYLNFDIPQNKLRTDLLSSQLANSQEQGYQLQLANSLNQYLLSGEGGWQDKDGVYHSYAEGPYAQRYLAQTQEAEWQWKRTKYLVTSLLPAQKDRTKALEALDKYQLQFMQGKTSAVIDLDLGLGETVNQWARLIIFMSLANMF